MYKEMKIIIRKEKIEVFDKIREINSQSFDTEAEANLVDNLRISGIPLISLIAETKGVIAGHILFSPVKLINDKHSMKIAGLAPMAVLPEFQNQGIGSALINEGLKHCKSEDCKAVVVLGHPEYYPKFGFLPSSHYGIRSEYDVPDEVFMIIELEKNSLTNHTGIVRYHEVFNQL